MSAASNTTTKDSARLNKRLCYILRYGALGMGLKVHEGGFVSFLGLMKLQMMRRYSKQDVLQEVETSVNHRKSKHFELKQQNGTTYIRATFCRNLQPSYFHEGTKVQTLRQSCIDAVLHHLQDYDLQDFTDEDVILTMMQQLKTKKKLNMVSLRILLVPAVEHVDLDSVYVTSAMIKLLYTNCPNLKFLSVRGCGYIVTDSVVHAILRKLPKLESLNVADCKHLTDKTLQSCITLGRNLKQLNLSWIQSFTDQGLLDLVVNCESLEYLDIFDLKLGEVTRPVLIEAVRQRGITVILKGLKDSDPDVTLENPSMLWPNFGKTF